MSAEYPDFPPRPGPAVRRTRLPAKPLEAGFFARDTVEVARDLLGTVLLHDSPEGRAAGRIVETEAYLFDDPACHACRGMTLRNRAMFGPPGRAYVYLIYGMYHCFNVVTGPRGVGEAVLIRALQPLEGLPLMAHRRNRDPGDLRGLCSGPGKLVMALGIGKAHDGADLRKGSLVVLPAASWPDPEGGRPRSIRTTTRIGITAAAEMPLRFYLEGNPFISRK